MHKVMAHPRETLSESEIALLTQLARGNALSSHGHCPAQSTLPNWAGLAGPLKALLSLLRPPLINAPGAARSEASRAHGAQRE